MHILLLRATDGSLLSDTDTAVLLIAIRKRHNPMSWFFGDWPLQNHFYRPISTLAFEFDNWRYHDWAAGYGLTNALLCASCTLLLFWFVAELTATPWFASAVAVLFSLWQTVGLSFVGGLGPWVSFLVLGIGVYRHRKNWKLYLPVWLTLGFLTSELQGEVSLQGRMLGWLPGRTASVMSIFAIAALAAYARFERLRTDVKADQIAITPLTPPATKSFVPSESRPRWAWPWYVAAALFTAMALASYEQAVMLPAALLGVAVSTKFQGKSPYWRVHGIFWLLLLGYLGIRHSLVSSAPSSYQLQQFRHGTGVFLNLADYILPVAGTLPAFLNSLDGGIFIIFAGGFLNFWQGIFATTGTIYVSIKDWRWPLTGWALSIIAYLPMAWLNPFDHYHYWPMAMRAIFVVGLAKVVFDQALIALSPPVLQAPPRSVPAPGSLLHH